MDIASFLASVQSSILAVGIRDSSFLFPLIESCHVVGLAVVFGTATILDFRLLGIASRSRPFSLVKSDVLKWVWAAFVLTVITGTLMFTTNATVYYGNFFFRTKVLLLALAGINMLVFELTTGRRAGDWGSAATTPRAAKAAAALSLVLWVGIIFMGRWIGYTTSDAEVTLDPDINLEELFPFPSNQGNEGGGLDPLFPPPGDEGELHD
jgi:hypothetical protein